VAQVYGTRFVRPRDSGAHAAPPKGLSRVETYFQCGLKLGLGVPARLLSDVLRQFGAAEEVLSLQRIASIPRTVTRMIWGQATVLFCLACFWVITLFVVCRSRESVRAHADQVAQPQLPKSAGPRRRWVLGITRQDGTAISRPALLAGDQASSGR